MYHKLLLPREKLSIASCYTPKLHNDLEIRLPVSQIQMKQGIIFNLFNLYTVHEISE